MYYLLRILIAALLLTSCRSNEKAADNTTQPDVSYNEPHRPKLHFSPKEKWMNDPNGMVFHKGEYHLFYQYHPDGMTWGPMHWGHAISKDLMHWEHLPIALFPDKNGMIFSGSAVVDRNNSSGLGTTANPPLVAIFTYHAMEKEKAGAIDYQTQGIAYSTDDGRTWTMYEGNPVLPNPGIKDFRDPKVFWHDESSKWIMILAVQDHMEIFGSPDLKNWSKLSEFGKEYGAHGGVWECPDLFPLAVEGEQSQKWVMIVSINPGGPNGGSATQYFIGDFDGKTFRPDTPPTITKWLDHGPDNYAGVTWSGAPDNRRIFLGWMSNWAYGEAVPTSPWRSAMTFPRDLSMVRIGNDLRVASHLSPELDKIKVSSREIAAQSVNGKFTLNNPNEDLSQSLISGTFEAKNFEIILSNTQKQELIIGYDAGANVFFIDRGNSGTNDFSENFNGRSTAPRLASSKKVTFQIAIDVSSVEVFFDDGVSVMTSLFFPDSPLSMVSLSAREDNSVTDVRVTTLKSVW